MYYKTSTGELYSTRTVNIPEGLVLLTTWYKNQWQRLGTYKIREIEKATKEGLLTHLNPVQAHLMKQKLSTESK